jgi:putative integral membrane protein (TIGR02587 family)
VTSLPRRWDREEELAFARSLARAAGGALVFALPLLMTQEMWQLGTILDRGRLLVFLLVAPLVLTGLCRAIGFRRDLSWYDAALDALVAYAVGAVVSAGMLALFGQLDRWSLSLVGTVAIQAVPAAFGAAVAKGQLGGDDNMEGSGRRPSYLGELFLMLAGAVFLAFNIAPTEEIEILARSMSAWHGLAAVGLSLLVLEAFVYALGFSGQVERRPVPRWREFVSFTVVGYIVALLTGLYMLWVLGRTDGESITTILRLGVVLAVPSSLGAAAARLIL